MIAFLTAAAPLQAWAQPAPAASTAPAPILRGLVLLDSPKALKPDGWPAAATPDVDAARTPEIAAADARSLLSPYLGKPIDREVLGKMRKSLLDYFAARKQPFVSVIVPAQTADNGVVQVEVLVGRLGKLSVTGNKYFAASEYTDALHLQPGETIDGETLDADVDWINTNPFRHATVVAEPGKDVGTTDLTIRAQDSRPLTVRAGVDNTGTSSTSLYRVNAGVEWGDAFGRGDDASLNYTTSPDFYTVREYSGGYTFNLPWRDMLSLQASYATTSPPHGSIVGNAGVNAQVSLRYTTNLPSAGPVKQSLVLGYDFKSTNNNLLFGGFSVFSTTSEVDQFLLGYRGQESDRLGTTSFGLDVVASPGGLTAGNNDAALSAQQAGAKARYLYGRLTADRLTPLPGGLSWDLRGTFQLTNTPLLPSEQLTLGGYTSVRGFEEQAATRDQGVLLESELRLKPISTNLSRLVGFDGLGDQLTPFVFTDYGWGWNRRPIAGLTSSVKLAGLGPGFTWQAGPNLSVRFSYGFPIVGRDEAAPKLGPQFGVQLSY
jgi:hemolysin activation/secretion protein